MGDTHITGSHIEGDTHITSDMCTGIHKSRGYTYHCDTGTFCHAMIFAILNHVTKRQTPSLDKDSTTESKACGGSCEEKPLIFTI